MRLTVAADRCTGHGRCYSVAPDLLTYDDEGFVSVKGATIDVPAGQEASARAAEAACPEDAITTR
jgi:ferredoxin